MLILPFLSHHSLLQPPQHSLHHSQQTPAFIPHASKPCPFRTFHIAFAIADEDGSHSINMVLRTGGVDHARSGFTAVASLRVLWNLSFRMMGAVKEGVQVSALFYCPHHIDGKIPEYTKACNCRKPATGMIDAACAEYDIDRTRAVLIGDSESDMECARRAGLRGVRYEGGSLLEVVERVLGWLE